MTDGKRWVAICLNIWGENQWIPSTRAITISELDEAIKRTTIDYDLGDIGFGIRYDSKPLHTWAYFNTRKQMIEFIKEKENENQVH